VVFTVKDSLAVWNYVQVGHRNSRQVEIIEGLKEGDRVIVSGNATIGHEAWVKVEPSSNSKP
jgi:multidrug efflux pump subunit AcrA (membrane-fusion protein)